MSEKNLSKLYEMVVKGDKYREDYDFEMFGEEVTAVLRPLKDEEFLPIAGKLQDKFDMDEEDAVEEIEDAELEDGGIDISDMDKEFVQLIKIAAKRGIVAEDMEGPDGEALTQEQVDEMVDNMIGGYSVELGGKVLELSGNVRDAERFRGRGSQ